MSSSVDGFCDASDADSQPSMLDNRQGISRLLCLPMPPDHEYELPMFSRGPVEDSLGVTDKMESGGHEDPVSDPFYSLSSGDGGEDTTTMDLFPPSLQQLLESAYSNIYEETLLEEQEVPFDLLDLNILESSLEELESLDVLGEVEMTSSPAPSSPGHSVSLNSNLREQIQTSQSTISSSDGTGTDQEECISASVFQRDKTQRKKSMKIGQLRDTDTFIENKCIRKRRFINGLQTLITKIKHIRGRTGAAGEFVAVFEGQEYTLENMKHVAKSRLMVRKSKKKSMKPMPVKILEGEEFEDDHRYAATLLTQKLSSPSVRDHQYNEAISSSGDPAKDGSRLREHLYIPLQYQRDRTFEQFLRSTFSRVNLLEIRTGAAIDSKFHYEGCDFTRHNFKEVTCILQKKRNRRNVVARIDVEHIQKPDGTQVCRIFNRPCSTVIAISSHAEATTPQGDSQQPVVGEVYAGTNKDLLRAPVYKNPSDSDSVEFNRTCKTNSELVETTTASVYSNNFENSIQDGNLSGLILRAESSLSSGTRNNFALKDGLGARTEDEHRSPSPLLAKVSTDYETDNQNEANSEASSSSAAVTVVMSNPNSRCQTVNEEAPGGVLASRGGRNDDTGPLCRKCQRFFPPNSGKRPDGFIPWLRCFDPFCQHLVHASCIGLYVMSRHDLRRLPPYYCEAHRDDM